MSSNQQPDPTTNAALSPAETTNDKSVLRQTTLNSYLDATTASHCQKLWTLAREEVKMRDHVKMASDAIAKFESLSKGIK